MKHNCCDKMFCILFSDSQNNPFPSSLYTLLGVLLLSSNSGRIFPMNFKHMRSDTGRIFESNTAQFTGKISTDPVRRFVNVEVAFRAKPGATHFTLKWSERFGWKRKVMRNWRYRVYKKTTFPYLSFVCNRICSDNCPGRSNIFQQMVHGIVGSVFVCFLICDVRSPAITNVFPHTKH